MAVEDKYINTNVATDGGIDSAVFVNGSSKIVEVVKTFEVAAADDDGSIYRIAKGLVSELIPVSIEIMADAITAGTDYDIGFYETKGGAVIDKDILADGLDFSSGFARSAKADGLATVAIADVEKTIAELCGHTVITKKRAYDLAITANTVGSAAGTISVRMVFVQK